MKLKYNDKTYVVFATEEEIVDEDLIKIEEDYFEWSSYSRLLLNLTTTQVLRNVTTNHKVLQAYKVKINHIELVRVEYTSLSDSQLHKLIEHIVEFKCFKNKVLTRFQETYATISLQEEETEEQVKERVSSSSLDDIKYFKL